MLDGCPCSICKIEGAVIRGKKSGNHAFISLRSSLSMAVSIKFNNQPAKLFFAEYSESTTIRVASAAKKQDRAGKSYNASFLSYHNVRA